MDSYSLLEATVPYQPSSSSADDLQTNVLHCAQPNLTENIGSGPSAEIADSRLFFGGANLMI